MRLPTTMWSSLTALRLAANFRPNLQQKIMRAKRVMIRYMLHGNATCKTGIFLIIGERTLANPEGVQKPAGKPAGFFFASPEAEMKITRSFRRAILQCTYLTFGFGGLCVGKVGCLGAFGGSTCCLLSSPPPSFCRFGPGLMASIFCIAFYFMQVYGVRPRNLYGFPYMLKMQMLSSTTNRCRSQRLILILLLFTTPVRTLLISSAL